MHVCARIFAWAWDFLVGSTAYPMQHTVGIEVRVTKEILPAPTSNGNGSDNSTNDAPPWTTTSAPCRTTPPTPTNPHRQYLSPHVFQGRNSLCSANDYTLRRRRPMTLRIGPRLSLPSRSTSAPTTTTADEWPAIRPYQKKSPTPSSGGGGGCGGCGGGGGGGGGSAPSGSRTGWRSRRSVTTAGAPGHQHHVIASAAATAQAKMQAEQGSIGELRGYHNLRSRRHTLANVRKPFGRARCCHTGNKVRLNYAISPSTEGNRKARRGTQRSFFTLSNSNLRVRMFRKPEMQRMKEASTSGLPEAAEKQPLDYQDEEEGEVFSTFGSDTDEAEYETSSEGLPRRGGNEQDDETGSRRSTENGKAWRKPTFLSDESSLLATAENIVRVERKIGTDGAEDISAIGEISSTGKSESLPVFKSFPSAEELPDSSKAELVHGGTPSSASSHACQTKMKMIVARMGHLVSPESNDSIIGNEESLDKDVPRRHNGNQAELKTTLPMFEIVDGPSSSGRIAGQFSYDTKEEISRGITKDVSTKAAKDPIGFRREKDERREEDHLIEIAENPHPSFENPSACLPPSSREAILSEFGQARAFRNSRGCFNDYDALSRIGGELAPLQQRLSEIAGKFRALGIAAFDTVPSSVRQRKISFTRHWTDNSEAREYLLVDRTARFSRGQQCPGNSESNVATRISRLQDFPGNSCVVSTFLQSHEGQGNSDLNVTPRFFPGQTCAVNSDVMRMSSEHLSHCHFPRPSCFSSGRNDLNTLAFPAPRQKYPVRYDDGGEGINFYGQDRCEGNSSACLMDGPTPTISSAGNPSTISTNAWKYSVNLPTRKKAHEAMDPRLKIQNGHPDSPSALKVANVRHGDLKKANELRLIYASGNVVPTTPSAGAPMGFDTSTSGIERNDSFARNMTCRGVNCETSIWPGVSCHFSREERWRKTRDDACRPRDNVASLGEADFSADGVAPSTETREDSLSSFASDCSAELARNLPSSDLADCSARKSRLYRNTGECQGNSEARQEGGRCVNYLVGGEGKEEGAYGDLPKDRPKRRAKMPGIVKPDRLGHGGRGWRKKGSTRSSRQEPTSRRSTKRNVGQKTYRRAISITPQIDSPETARGGENISGLQVEIPRNSRGIVKRNRYSCPPQTTDRFADGNINISSDCHASFEDPRVLFRRNFQSGQAAEENAKVGVPLENSFSKGSCGTCLSLGRRVLLVDVDTETEKETETVGKTFSSRAVSPIPSLYAIVRPLHSKSLGEDSRNSGEQDETTRLTEDGSLEPSKEFGKISKPESFGESLCSCLGEDAKEMTKGIGQECSSTWDYTSRCRENLEDKSLPRAELGEDNKEDDLSNGPVFPRTREKYDDGGTWRHEFPLMDASSSLTSSSTACTIRRGRDVQGKSGEINGRHFSEVNATKCKVDSDGPKVSMELPSWQEVKGNERKASEGNVEFQEVTVNGNSQTNPPISSDFSDNAYEESMEKCGRSEETPANDYEENFINEKSTCQAKSGTSVVPLITEEQKAQEKERTSKENEGNYDNKKSITQNSSGSTKDLASLVSLIAEKRAGGGNNCREKSFDRGPSDETKSTENDENYGNKKSVNESSSDGAQRLTSTVSLITTDRRAERRAEGETKGGREKYREDQANNCIEEFINQDVCRQVKCRSSLFSSVGEEGQRSEENSEEEGSDKKPISQGSRCKSKYRASLVSLIEEDIGRTDWYRGVSLFSRLSRCSLIIDRPAESTFHEEKEEIVADLKSARNTFARDSLDSLLCLSGSEENEFSGSAGPEKISLAKVDEKITIVPLLFTAGIPEKSSTLPFALSMTPSFVNSPTVSPMYRQNTGISPASCAQRPTICPPMNQLSFAAPNSRIKTMDMCAGKNCRHRIAVLRRKSFEPSPRGSAESAPSQRYHFQMVDGLQERGRRKKGEENSAHPIAVGGRKRSPTVPSSSTEGGFNSGNLADEANFLTRKSNTLFCQRGQSLARFANFTSHSSPSSSSSSVARNTRDRMNSTDVRTDDVDEPTNVRAFRGMRSSPEDFLTDT